MYVYTVTCTVTLLFIVCVYDKEIEIRITKKKEIFIE